jgi:hypothetical protein
MAAASDPAFEAAWFSLRHRSINPTNERAMRANPERGKAWRQDPPLIRTSLLVLYAAVALCCGLLAPPLWSAVQGWNAPAKVQLCDRVSVKARSTCLQKID